MTDYCKLEAHLSNLTRQMQISNYNEFMSQKFSSIKKVKFSYEFFGMYVWVGVCVSKGNKIWKRKLKA